MICYYYDNGHNPRLVIRPAKIEVAHPEPKIYILRDIISEIEMNRLKELAAPIVSVCVCVCVFVCEVCCCVNGCVLLTWSGPVSELFLAVLPLFVEEC